MLGNQNNNFAGWGLGEVMVPDRKGSKEIQRDSSPAVQKSDRSVCKPGSWERLVVGKLRALRANMLQMKHT
eukprot:663988-Amphidinium_carterae.1